MWVKERVFYTLTHVVHLTIIALQMVKNCRHLSVPLIKCAEANSEALESKKFQTMNVNRLKDTIDARMVVEKAPYCCICLQVKITTHPQHGATFYVVTVKQ
jgi:hypothetical protein